MEKEGKGGGDVCVCGGGRRSGGGANLIPGGLVRGHVALQLGAVGEGVVAERAGKVFIVFLMAVLDVLLERRKPLVAPVAVGAGQQLGKGIWRSRWQVWSGGWGRVRRRERGRGGRGKQAKRSVNQWQPNGAGCPALVWQLSVQSAAHECKLGITHTSPALTHKPTHTQIHMHTIGGHTLFFLLFDANSRIRGDQPPPALTFLFLSLFLGDRKEGGCLERCAI